MNAHVALFSQHVYFLPDILNSFFNVLVTIDSLKFVYKPANCAIRRLYLEAKMAFLCLWVGIKRRYFGQYWDNFNNYFDSRIHK